jgi:hypothetical protein
MASKVPARWDAFAAKVCNEICAEEVLALNRPQHCLNAVGYANLVKKFYEGKYYLVDSRYPN